MRAIKAHALLHREHRACDEDGQILANFDDYGSVRKLMSDVLATAVEMKVRKQIVETVDAIKAVMQQRPDEVVPRESLGVTIRETAAELRLGHSTAWRRIQQAEALGLVENLEERRGNHAARYIFTDSNVTGEGDDLLPTVDALKRACEEAARERENRRAHG